jgi:oligopeptide transport system permease protein
VTGLVLRRLAQLPLVLLAVFVLTFSLAWIAPGSPFDDAEGRRPSPEVREAMLRRYRLDDPVGFFVDYLGRASGVSWALGRAPRPFDLGPSLRHPDRSVNEIVADGLPISMSIGVAAIAIAATAGTAAGLVGALRPGTAADAAAQLLAVVGVSVPVFVTGSVLLILFCAKLHWFPVGGWDGARSLVLPAVALSLVPAAYVARLMRASMMEQMSADYMRTARAKGLSRREAALRHAVRNAFRPVLSYLGPATAFAVTGSFVVEKVFAVPGLGQHFVSAVLSKDITLLMGVVLVLATLVVLLNLAVDVLYAWLDPRVSVSAG